MAIDGKARGARRCTKRIGSKKCGNWSEAGGDRCSLHPRTVNPMQPLASKALESDRVARESGGGMFPNVTAGDAGSAGETLTDVEPADLKKIEIATNASPVVGATAARLRTEEVRRRFAKLLRAAAFKANRTDVAKAEPSHAPWSNAAD